MNAITGMTDLLLRTPLSDEQHLYAETVCNGANSLLSIINNVLDFSKIEAGRMELEQRPFDIRQCVQSSLDLVAPSARDKNLEIGGMVEAGTPAAFLGDAARVQQILDNFLGNAVKFTEEGEVALTADSKPLDGKEFWHELHIAVRDTGIGIPADQREILFQSFSQVDASPTRRHGGAGLGLAISKKLAELMGGRVWVESEPGFGSTFHCAIRLQGCATPEGLADAEGLAEAPAQVLAPTTPAVRAGEGRRAVLDPLDPMMGLRHPLRILLAEDNPINQRVALLVLTRLGYSADVASNGAHAVAAVRRRPYDVVFMDVQMPEVDGMEATRRIRALSNAVAQPRIVAVTANALQGDRADCLRAGMDDYLSKPFRPADLVDALLKCRSLAPPQASRHSAGAPMPPHNVAQQSGAEEKAKKPAAFERPAPETPAVSDAPVFDPESLQQLREVLGDKADELLSTLIGDFLEEAPRLLATARQAMAEQQVTELRRAAHTLKSNSRDFGALALSQAARELEARSKTTIPPGVEAMVALLENHFEAAKTALLRVREEMEGAAGMVDGLDGSG
jgi:CheY-like chemotaxis protein